MNQRKRKPIRSFRDRDVYARSFLAMEFVYKKILNMLPDYEKYDLTSQLRRSSKAIPRLIAEGYAKRHQIAGFRKYLDDAMAESNEMIASLEQVKCLYNNNSEEIIVSIQQYEIISKQLYKLSMGWGNMKR